MLGSKNAPNGGGLFNIIICISTLSKLKGKYNISEVLPLIFSLFSMQNPDSAFDNQKAKLYKTNRPEFDKNSRDFTKKNENPCLLYHQKNNLKKY